MIRKQTIGDILPLTPPREEEWNNIAAWAANLTQTENKAQVVIEQLRTGGLVVFNIGGLEFRPKPFNLGKGWRVGGKILKIFESLLNFTEAKQVGGDFEMNFGLSTPFETYLEETLLDGSAIARYNRVKVDSIRGRLRNLGNPRIYKFHPQNLGLGREEIHYHTPPAWP